MSLRQLGINYYSLCKFLPLISSSHLRLNLSTSAMSSRPNFQGGRRGGARRGGPGRGGGGRGEQRWWDPVWRAERLAQQAAEVLSCNSGNIN